VRKRLSGKDDAGGVVHDGGHGTAGSGGLS
jgi:hypothetical protein